MRLLFLIPSLAVGGAERQVTVLASGLRARGHTAAVAVTYPGGSLERELATSGVELHSLGRRARWDAIAPLRRWRHLVRAWRPDVVHGYMPAANLRALLARGAHPGVRVVWGVRDSGLEFSRYGVLTRINVTLAARLATRADLVIANSRAGARCHVAHGYPTATMEVVPNGIDTARFRVDPAARAITRAAWGIGDGDRLIGLVGRLDPMKDHPTFLRAAARLAADPRLHFACIGGGGRPDYVARVRRLGDESGLGARLHWIDAAPDMPAAYNAMDVCALTSAFGEGFPNAVGEAMACGVPCAVTECGDAAIVVGATGRVVPVGDDAALADAWVALLATDREELGCRARERIRAEFSVERLLDRTESLLLPLAGGRGSR